MRSYNQQVINKTYTIINNKIINKKINIKKNTIYIQTNRYIFYKLHGI